MHSSGSWPVGPEEASAACVPRSSNGWRSIDEPLRSVNHAWVPFRHGRAQWSAAHIRRIFVDVVLGREIARLGDPSHPFRARTGACPRLERPWVPFTTTG